MSEAMTLAGMGMHTGGEKKLKKLSFAIVRHHFITVTEAYNKIPVTIAD